MGRKIRFICSILLIVCMLAGGLTGCNKTSPGKPASTETKEVPIKDFLDKNYSSLDVNDDKNYSSFSLLNSDLNSNQLFLLGGFTGTKTNEDLRLKFLKYFKENAGIRYYIQDIPYSFSGILDQYLSTGDEKILADLSKSAKGTVLWSKANYDNYKKLYEYNKSLPKDERIIVIGIGAEYRGGSAFKFMHSLIPDTSAPGKIESAIKELNNLYENPTSDGKIIKDFSTNLKKSIDENIDTYKGYLGDKFFDFQLVNDNILAGFEIERTYTIGESEFYKVGNKILYENFKKIYPRIQNAGKIYGEFETNPGGIFLKTLKDVDYFGALVNNGDSPLKGKVLSIMSIYKNCGAMVVAQNGKYSSRTISNYASDDNPLDPFIEGDATLFRLKGAGSPFEKNLIWSETHFYPGTRQGSEVTTDYYQYIVVIKGSKPVEPLEQ